MIKNEIGKKIQKLVIRGKKYWAKHAKKITIIGGGVCGLVFLVAISLCIVSMMGCRNCNQGSAPSPTPTISSTPRNPLTGEIIAAPMTSLPQVFAVMVENSADAWPLSGIDQAFEVIEAPVEGNIPRFIAFFSDEQDVKKIGPVRSSRLYYLDWAQEFNAIYGHVGGSPQALAAIKDRGVLDLDQFFQSEYYYRDEVTRYAPHNVYTTTDDLKKAATEIATKYENAAPKYDSWLFQDGISQSSSPSVIHIDWPSATNYNVDWLYSPPANSYTYKQGGNTYIANNVAVIETDVAVIPGDDKGRKELTSIGSGLAHIFQNGLEIIGTWKKSSAKERLRFYDSSNQEVVMNAGKTWIQVVSDIGTLSVTNQD